MYTLAKHILIKPRLKMNLKTYNIGELLLVGNSNWILIFEPLEYLCHQKLDFMDKSGFLGGSNFNQVVKSSYMRNINGAQFTEVGYSAESFVSKFQLEYHVIRYRTLKCCFAGCETTQTVCGRTSQRNYRCYKSRARSCMCDECTQSKAIKDMCSWFRVLPLYIW